MVTNAFLNCIMGNVFGSDVSTPLPTEYWIGLSLTTPSPDGTGVTEPAVGSYSRVKISGLSVPTDGTITVTSDVDFSQTTEDWGTITHYALYGSSNDNVCLLYDALSAPKMIQADTQPRFRANTLKFTLRNPV